MNRYYILISISIALAFITLKNCALRAPLSCLFIHLLFMYLTSQMYFQFLKTLSRISGTTFQETLQRVQQEH